MRQSAAEIDHAILDVAAGIFAVHGFAHTSVQQIADAVGYSKPGLHGEQGPAGGPQDEEVHERGSQGGMYL